MQIPVHPSVALGSQASAIALSKLTDWEEFRFVQLSLPLTKKLLSISFVLFYNYFLQVPVIIPLDYLSLQLSEWNMDVLGEVLSSYIRELSLHMKSLSPQGGLTYLHKLSQERLSFCATLTDPGSILSQGRAGFLEHSQNSEAMYFKCYCLMVHSRDVCI